MKRKLSTQAITYCAICLAINVVLGTVVLKLQIPMLFLDAIGTIFIAVLIGPWHGAAVGLLSNVLIGALTNPKDIPFAIVSVVIAIVAALIARKWKFNYITAIITGIVLSAVAPLVAAPIVIYVYGGLTGGGMDLIVTLLRRSGADIFTASFFPRIGANLIDKIASCLLVSVLLSRLPADMLNRVKNVGA